nr:MAG TPA: hypothetical protein [Caudoviricetes sp.]
MCFECVDFGFLGCRRFYRCGGSKVSGCCCSGVALAVGAGLVAFEDHNRVLQQGGGVLDIRSGKAAVFTASDLDVLVLLQGFVGGLFWEILPAVEDQQGGRTKKQPVAGGALTVWGVGQAHNVGVLGVGGEGAAVKGDFLRDGETELGEIYKGIFPARNQSCSVHSFLQGFGVLLDHGMKRGQRGGLRFNGGAVQLVAVLDEGGHLDLTAQGPQVRGVDDDFPAEGVAAADLGMIKTVKHGVILLLCSDKAVFPELPQETETAGQPFQTVGGRCDFFPALHLFGGFLLGHDRRITDGGFAGFISGHFVILLDFDLAAGLDEIHHAEHQAGKGASAQNEDKKGKTHDCGLLSVCCMLHLLSIL